MFNMDCIGDCGVKGDGDWFFMLFGVLFGCDVWGFLSSVSIFFCFLLSIVFIDIGWCLVIVSDSCWWFFVLVYCLFEVWFVRYVYNEWVVVVLN